MKKYRVQLLDSNDNPIEEINILTSADSVLFEDGQTFQEKLDAGALTGPKGATGATGAKGDQGIPGKDGEPGEKGDQGIPGIAGAKGATGAQGPKGDTGLTGSQGPKGDTGARGDQGIQGKEGIQGPKGDTGASGKDFHIAKTYATIALMNADFSNSAIKEGDFVMIASAASDPTADKDNAKLYVKGSTSFTYIGDLSGAQGMKGETGATGATGKQGTQGIQGTQGPKGETGATGPKGEVGDNIKVGVSYETGVARKIFLKEMQ